MLPECLFYLFLTTETISEQSELVVSWLAEMTWNDPVVSCRLVTDYTFRLHYGNQSANTFFEGIL
jgi:hypothetical protein